MKVLRNVFAGIGVIAFLVFFAGFVSGFFQKPFTAAEVVEAYRHEQLEPNTWVEFEVREVVDHNMMVGQSFWAVNDGPDEVAFIIDKDRVENVEVGDVMQVYVTDGYQMFGSYIFEFDSTTNVKVFKEES